MVGKFAKMNRDDWLFACALGAIVLTLIVTAYINGDSPVWVIAAVAALMLMLFIGVASGLRALDRCDLKTLHLRLPRRRSMTTMPRSRPSCRRSRGGRSVSFGPRGARPEVPVYLKIIERKVQAGLDHIRILYPDAPHDQLIAHIARLRGNEQATFLRTDQQNVPHLLNTDKGILLVFPQPNKKAPVAFHVSRPERVEQLRAYFTVLASKASVA